MAITQIKTSTKFVKNLQKHTTHNVTNAVNNKMNITAKHKEKPVQSALCLSPAYMTSRLLPVDSSPNSLG